jgi:hypothetical protein
VQIDETFRAKVWTQESTGAWHFVTLPADLSKRIRTLTTGLAQAVWLVSCCSEDRQDELGNIAVC